MTDSTIEAARVPGVLVRPARPQLDDSLHPRSALLFFSVLALGLFFVAYSIYLDVIQTGVHATSSLPFVLLGVALLVALGFEFVNGFHDTANAVATVIYTHSLSAPVAVVWSGLFNFLGVMVSSGAVAFGIISLLPVELILRVGSGAGFAMVFALLIAAIVWNLATWYLGLPASSSHTLIGSIIGVGLANQLMSASASGVDWMQASKVGVSLLLSPLIGFLASAALLLLLKRLAKTPELYAEPAGGQPPPRWIRGLLILTCTGVSFAHGSNDGQKGMGLIMLILIGVVPTAYALNRALPDRAVPSFLSSSEEVARRLEENAENRSVSDAKQVVGEYLRTHQRNPEVASAMASLVRDIKMQIEQHGSFRRLPFETVQNVRNDMYLVSEAIPRLIQDPAARISKGDAHLLSVYRSQLDQATRFIPLWVKIAVAIALGLGTMVGWKRIVVTVGEKIGKTHLSYAQGASAELVAATTIAAADVFGLPVSTTHVLSSGVAGSMAANRSGLQLATVRNLLMAWVLTLPAAIALSAGLYWVFSQAFAGLPAIAQVPSSPSSIQASQPAVGGNVTIAGSSTLLPLSKAIAAEFERQHPGVRVTVQASGSSAGFQKLCAGQIDIADASRPINATEIAACKARGIEFIELPIAFGNLAVVVNRQNGFVDCLRLEELEKIWEPAAEGKITAWNQVRPDFPAERLALFGPGPGSGTFDYFTAAVIGTESSSRGDYQQNDDGAITARSVAADPSALGYLAFALYRSNAEGLKLVAVDTGQGCVRPSAETAADGSYAPLSRPLFLYVNKAASARAEVGAVVSSYLSPGGSDQIAKLGQVPLPPAVIARERWRFEVGEAGTVLGGHGSVVGLRPAAFEEERDRVRSALVR